MTIPSLEPGTSARRPGLMARATGVIFSPRPTFEHIVEDPRWLGALAVIVILMGATSFLFMSTEVGREAVLAKQLDSMEAFGVQITAELEAEMERGLERAQYFSMFNGLFWVVIMLVAAGILFAVFNGVLGGNATFRQVFAVTVFSSFVTVLQQLFTMPIAYARGSLDSATNLSVFLPMLDDSSFVARLLGAIDVFWIWWLTVLAIGVAVLYRRRTQPILTTFLVLYGVIALAIAVFQAVRAGNS
jgi:hypothetical protein